jgi:hypothetical protein
MSGVTTQTVKERKMLNLVNLDEKTRAFMLDEVDNDISSGQLYLSPRLTPQGRDSYPTALRDAIASGSDDSLRAALDKPGVFVAREMRNTKHGQVSAAVPVTAPETLAEGEFNRFYIRGVCGRALEESKDSVVAYRAKSVANPRTDSANKIGERYNPQVLLNDLRQNIGIDTALGLPSGPNSGLSVQLPN